MGSIVFLVKQVLQLGNCHFTQIKISVWTAFFENIFWFGIYLLICSRSRTNSGSSASVDEEKKNGSIDGNERSGGAKVGADSHKKVKNGEEHIGSGPTANNTRNVRFFYVKILV